jgi:tRNA(fMet)-specific endonuclease VapC
MHASPHQTMRAKGRPLPTHDLWIASLALEHGQVLHTRDSHFAEMPGLATM